VVERGKAAGQHDRLLEQRDDDVGAQPDPAGLPGDPGQRLDSVVERPLRQAEVVAPRVVARQEDPLGQRHAVEAESLGGESDLTDRWRAGVRTHDGQADTDQRIDRHE
jgi:hypothetical protein